MARRGKTKIGGGEQEQSRTMMSAAQSGTAARQRATEAYATEEDRQRQMAFQEGQALGKMGMGAVEAQQQLEQREKIATGAEMQRGRQIELEEAKAGLKRTGGAEPPLSRAERLRQEMDQGAATGRSPEEQARLQKQGQKPVEIGGRNPAMPGYEMTELGKAREARKDFDSMTRRMAVQGRLQRARASGDKTNIAKVKQLMMQPLKSSVKRMNRMMSHRASADDWKSVKAMAGGVPDPELMRDIENSDMTPRVRDFLSRQIAAESLKFIEESEGELPDGNLIDFTSPAMKTFMDFQQTINTLAQNMGPLFQGITSLDEKIRFTNQLAASFARMALANPQAAQQGLIPSQAATPEQEAALQAQQQANVPFEPTGAAGAAGAGAAGGTQPKQAPGVTDYLKAPSTFFQDPTQRK